jgi:ring-1,2-phenylacetyl-CoA epoxidase subunit PaaE
MSLHFYSLAVKEVKQETADCVSVELDVPETLLHIFSFQPGQNIVIKKDIDGEEVRRTYSICAAPYENKLRIAIKRVEGGLFSNFANNNLKAGDTVDVMAPAGRFNTPLSSVHSKNYVAFVAGSGITPVVSILKAVLKEEPNSRFTLVYGNQNRQSIIFFEELEALKNKYISRFTLINVLSREKTDTPIHFGRIDTQKMNVLSTLIDYTITDEFFICGPEEMIFSIRDYLTEKGIDKKKLHFELFTSTNKVKKIDPLNKITSDRMSYITITADGSSKDIAIPFNSDLTILDAALLNGADLPYACKGGMCCTCKAKLIEGKVQMDVHWGLEEDEIANGFVLTCQAHPLTEKVVVDFDMK